MENVCDVILMTFSVTQSSLRHKNDAIYDFLKFHCVIVKF